MKKAPEAFRTISEVADLLDTPAHVLRFWESKFYQIRPVKRAGGRRYYRPDDVALINGIRVLLQDRGMTIRGVQRILQEQGVKAVAALGLPLPEVTGAEGKVLEAVGIEDDEPVEIEDAETVQPAPDGADDAPADLAPMPAFDEVGVVPSVFLDAAEWHEPPAPTRDPPAQLRDEALSPAASPVAEAGDIAPMDDEGDAPEPGTESEAVPPALPPAPDAKTPIPDAAPMTDDDLLTSRAAAVTPVAAPPVAAAPPPSAVTPTPLAPPPMIALEEPPALLPTPERPRLARALRGLPRPLPAPQRDRLALAARRIDALLERMSEASGAGRW